MTWLAVACGPPDGPSPTPSLTNPIGAPVLLPPPELAPLSWRYVVESAVPTRAVMHVQTDEAAWLVTSPHQTTAHALPVLGVAAGLSASVSVLLSADDGRSWLTGPLDLQQPDVPKDWPEVAIDMRLPDRMEPGVTLVGVSGDARTTWIAAIDDQTRPTWLYGPTPAMLALRWRSDHIAVLQNGVKQLLEFDLFGETRRTIGPDGSGADLVIPGTTAFHHELLDLPDGTHVVLDRLPKVLPDYPGSYEDPDVVLHDVEVGIEQLVHFDDDGGVIDVLPFDEVFDIERIGYGGLIEEVYGLDWIHTNAVIYDAAQDAWIVSARHQDAIASIDRTTHALRWLVAPPVNWRPAWSDALLTPTGPWFQPYHQHAPVFSSTGTLLVFDNGNARADPWSGEVLDPQPSSLATELVIDEDARTVSQPWSFVPADAPVWSGAMGNVEDQPLTGNRLVDFAYVQSTAAGWNHEVGRAAPSIRLMEIAMPGEVVWDVTFYLSAPVGEVVEGLWAFRAHRRPHLYPDGWTVTFE